MYIYIYLCVYISMYICMCKRAFVHIFVFTYMRTCTCMCTDRHIYVDVYNICTRRFIYIYIHTYIQTYIQTYIRTHMFIKVLDRLAMHPLGEWQVVTWGDPHFGGDGRGVQAELREVDERPSGTTARVA